MEACYFLKKSVHAPWLFSSNLRTEPAAIFDILIFLMVCVGGRLGITKASFGRLYRSSVLNCMPSQHEKRL